MNYIIATTKSWNILNFKRLKKQDKKNKWYLLTDKEDLNLKNLDKIKPRYIFFPHWSWIIPRNIFEKYDCVVFHMTDLPYGRGGSPLQNLIVRGHKKTKLSAIKVVEELDAGPIYFKNDLDLSGTAQDILKRASLITFDLIKKMVSGNYSPLKQSGKITKFERRKPLEGDISNLKNLSQIYDYIRMLDGEGYPKAFLEKNNIRFEFDKAVLKDEEIKASVKIIIKKNNI